MKKKEKRKTLAIVMTIFIALSMIISIFAIVLDNYQSDELSYNGHTFKITDSGYRVKLNGAFMDFQYYPSDLERINISKDIVDTLKNSQAVALLFDPNSSTDDLIYIDFARFEMSQQLGKPMYFAVTQPSEAYPLTVAGCENATLEVPIIFMNMSSDSTFTVSGQNAGCIIMNARLREIIALKERLIYALNGVMVN
jgi:hypothetical protein